MEQIVGGLTLIYKKSFELVMCFNEPPKKIGATIFAWAIWKPRCGQMRFRHLHEEGSSFKCLSSNFLRKGKEGVRNI